MTAMKTEAVEHNLQWLQPKQQHLSKFHEHLTTPLTTLLRPKQLGTWGNSLV